MEEFGRVGVSETELTIGAGLTISEFQNRLRDYDKCKFVYNFWQKLLYIDDFSLAHESPVVKLLLRTFPVIGYEQLRNFVSWVGNVASSWYISDISLCLLVSNSELSVINFDGKERRVKVDNNFFVGHWKVSLAPDEMVTSVVLPLKQV